MPSYIREHPRFSAELAVEVLLPDGAVVHVRGVNISRAGMQLVADTRSAQLISGGQGTAGGPAHCGLRFPLSWPGRERTAVQAQCRIAFMRREAERKFLIGAHFRGFEGDGEQVVDAYIEWRSRQPHLYP